jgi:hypothetical protein
MLFAGPPPTMPPGVPTPPRGKSLAIPIGTVIDSFANHPDAAKRIALAVPDVQAAGQTRTVPGAARVMHGGEAGEAALRAEAALSRSALGARGLAFYRRHGPELTGLVRENRKVQAEWHRSGAAELLQAATRMVLDPQSALPAQLSNGLRIPQVLERFSVALRPFASPEFRADVAKARRAVRRRAKRGLPDPGGLTFAAILDLLERRKPPARSAEGLAR